MGGPETAASCPILAGERGSDFSNNGNVGTEDYVFLSTNWLMTSGCQCSLPIAGDNDPEPTGSNVVRRKGSNSNGGAPAQQGTFGAGLSGQAPTARATAARSTTKVRRSARKVPKAQRARVDLNGDGVIDWADIRIFEQQHGLPTTLSTKMSQSVRRNP